MMPQAAPTDKGDIEAHTEDDEGLVVSWDGDKDPANPHNWSLSRKLTIATLLSLGGLVSTSSASMMAPALDTISADLHLSSSATQLMLSIYLLAFVFGPLIIAPCSEVYGRKPVWLACHVWYLCWNAMCPVGKHIGAMVVARLLSGLGGSVTQSIASVTAADIFRPESRGKALAFVGAASYLGSAVGPILGGVISQNLSWPWLFWIMSLFDLVITSFSAFLLHESYAPVLLARKSAHLRKDTGKNYRSKFETAQMSLWRKLVISLARPMSLFVARPVIPFLSVLLAYNFGTYCFVLSTFASVYATRYQVSETVSGLHYIAIALGSIIATQISGPLTDAVYVYLRNKKNGKVAPEYRVPIILPGALLMPLGLLLYGWAVEKTWHWMWVDVGAGLFSGGVMMGSGAILMYLIDEFAEEAGSAGAGARVLMNAMGFGFPVFAPALYVALGYGWGNTLLAGLGLSLCIPASVALWTWGPKLRSLGKKDLGHLRDQG